MKKYFSRPGFGGRFGSFMLCVAMLMFLTATIILADIRIATDKDNLSAIIKQTLFTTQTVRIPSGSGHGGAAVVRPRPMLDMPKLDETDTSSELSDAMVEMIYGMIMEQTGGEVDITLEEAKEFVEESSFDEFLSDTSAALVSDLITGENTIDLSEETISTLLTENAPLIEEHFGVTLDEQTITTITETVSQHEYVQQIRDKGVSKFVEENAGLMEDVGLGALMGGVTGGNPGGNGDTSTLPGSSSGMTGIVDLLNTARTITSVGAMIACGFMVAVFIGLLCLVNRKHIWYAIRGTGRTFVFSTFLISCVTLVMLFEPAVWSSFFSFEPMIGRIAELILRYTAPVHLGIGGTGVVLAILGTVLKFVAKGKARRLYLAEQAALSCAAPEIIEPVSAEPVEEVLVMEVEGDQVVVEPVPNEVPEETEV